MSEILEFRPRQAPVKKPVPVYPNSINSVCTFEVFSNGAVETEYKADEYFVVRHMARAMMTILGRSEKTDLTHDDKILLAMVRSMTDVIELQTPSDTYA